MPLEIQIPAFTQAALACTVVIAAAYPLLKRGARSYLLRKYTCVLDLEQLGKARKGEKVSGTAAICGGSVAGLFAARICSDHFERVIVVEPEAWTHTVEARAPPRFDTREVQGNGSPYNTINHKRSRVYQYTAVHLYQVLLLRFARRLFPRFDEEVKDWGVLIRCADFIFSLSGYRMRFPDAEEILMGPRRSIEPIFRQLICEARPEIEFVHGTATGFQLAADGSISAVSVRLADGTISEIEDCALAIDCTGIAQSGLKLLSRAIPNLPTDLRATYNADIVYSTLEYPLPLGFEETLFKHGMPKTKGSTGVFSYSPSPEVDTRMVALTRCDENTVVFTMGGWAVDMPTNLDEIRTFAQQVKNKKHIPGYFYKALDLLEPVAHLGTVFEARVTNCYKINYERAANVLPRNFVAMGDASMRVNPRFGQGVTKGAIGAITLDSVLRKMSPTHKDFGKVFFQKMTPRTDGAWTGTRFADYAAPTTTPLPNETHETGWLMRWYQLQVFKTIEKNENAASAFWHILMFLAPPTDIFAPSIVAGVVKETLWPSS
ncbi:hypothetical protein AURDEDRAFT_188108 [Auricularia subglabra TFB-10046 SS5]|uniref:FAD/NAD(P)-binding domain-containing protein n=1 Tax=Auricularia subglabra (strain TFB-10046 / SS5) TaxID=717982 RepID=J0WVT6_AURST|nr:hypothetical protein AURDEDRAFT_188108 [Auricularia subglabra TFB-10046 SS5]